LHHDLLEDTDAAMDRTAVRLNRAKRRLDKVAEEAKQYGESSRRLSLTCLTDIAGSTITIVVLIFILLILIIVFKT
jgi:syntaxin 8